MKKTLHILFPFVMLGILAASCNLQEDPQAVAGRAIVFGDEAGLRNYTYGFYNYLPDYSGAHRINITHDHSAKMSIGTYEQGAYTTSTSTSWSWGNIRNVNYFIKYNTDENLSEAVRNNYTGIARLFRAYLYYDKLVQYGNVPWIDKPLDPTDEDLYKTQDNRDVIISHIMEDLDFAAANITASGITPYSNTVNRWTALALKSRICLFEGTFRKYHASGSTYGAKYLEGCTITANELLQAAAEAAREVIEEGPYKLHTGTVYTTGGRGAYRDLFISDNPVTEEVMLAISQNRDLNVLGEANWYYNSTSYGPHLSMTRAFAKTYLNADGTFYNEKNANGTYKNFVQETTGRDARLCQTIRGADYTRKDASGAFVRTATDMSLSLTGYQYTKYVMDDSGYDNGRTNDNDVPLMRFAEVLLNYAEAKAELEGRAGHHHGRGLVQDHRRPPSPRRHHRRRPGHPAHGRGHLSPADLLPERLQPGHPRDPSRAGRRAHPRRLPPERPQALGLRLQLAERPLGRRVHPGPRSARGPERGRHL